MRIGIVGYGAVAAVHAKGLKAWGADVREVYGPKREKASAFAAANGIPRSTTAIEELYAEADAVIIASPSDYHFEQAQSALRAGLHCLVELPACSSAEAAKELLHLAKIAGVRVQCAHTTRFLPGIIQVQDYVRNGVLGEMHHVISVRAIPPRSRSWIDDAVLHHAAHHVDLLLHWFGSVTPVACVGYPQTEGAQDAALIAQLANGAPVNVSVSYTCRIQETRLTCVGADHTVTTDGFSFIESDNGVFTWRGDAQGSYEAAVQKQDRAFVESCSGGAPAVPWRDTIRLAECLDVFRNKGRPG